MSLSLHDAIALVDRLVADHRAATDGLNALGDYLGWMNGRAAADRALESALVKAGASVRTGSESAVRLAGVRSVSAMGLIFATINWQIAARRRAARG